MSGRSWLEPLHARVVDPARAVSDSPRTPRRAHAIRVAKSPPRIRAVAYWIARIGRLEAAREPPDASSESDGTREREVHARVAQRLAFRWHLEKKLPIRLSPTKRNRLRALTTTTLRSPARDRPPCTWVGGVGRSASCARDVADCARERHRAARRTARRPLARVSCARAARVVAGMSNNAHALAQSPGGRSLW